MTNPKLIDRRSTVRRPNVVRRCRPRQWWLDENVTCAEFQHDRLSCRVCTLVGALLSVPCAASTAGAICTVLINGDLQQRVRVWQQYTIRHVSCATWACAISIRTPITTTFSYSCSHNGHIYKPWSCRAASPPPPLVVMSSTKIRKRFRLLRQMLP